MCSGLLRGYSRLLAFLEQLLCGQLHSPAKHRFQLVQFFHRLKLLQRSTQALMVLGGQAHQANGAGEAWAMETPFYHQQDSKQLPALLRVLV